MEKISDKNLICIILTAALAFLTIGNAFHSGNWVLGFETLFMWLILYSFLPLAEIIDKKLALPEIKIDIVPFLKQTIDNRYIFISFCLSLLFSMIFDDTLNHIGRFIEDTEILDLLAIVAVFLLSALISLNFYYLTSKNNIDKLKSYGQKIDIPVESVKFLNNKYYILGYVINPHTGKKQRLVAQTCAKSKKEIPQIFSVYFDRKKANEYFFDTNF